MPETNVELEDVELELAGDGASGLTVNAQARSGGGTLSAEGRVTLVGAGPEGRIAVEGDAFEVVDTVDAQVVVSPDLDLVLTRDGIELTGSVTGAAREADAARHGRVGGGGIGRPSDRRVR